MTLREALNTEHRDLILAILTKSSSRMRYRRANLEDLFKKIGLSVQFTTADMKELLKELT